LAASRKRTSLVFTFRDNYIIYFDKNMIFISEPAHAKGAARQGCSSRINMPILVHWRSTKDMRNWQNIKDYSK